MTTSTATPEPQDHTEDDCCKDPGLDFADGSWDLHPKGETLTIEAMRPDYGLAKLAGELVPASLGIGVTIIVLAVAVRVALLVLSL